MQKPPRRCTISILRQRSGSEVGRLSVIAFLNPMCFESFRFLS